MTTKVWEIKEGADWPPYEAQLTDLSGPIDLSDAEVEFFMREIEGEKFVTGEAAIVDAETGVVQWNWADDGSETDVPGMYRVEFLVRFNPASPSEREQRIPNDDFNLIRVVANLSA